MLGIFLTKKKLYRKIIKAVRMQKNGKAAKMTHQRNVKMWIWFADGAFVLLFLLI